ncbi:lectin [Candidatus Saccharibacteria bacterium]|nr:lectin [Candidatus Saccharibacteria bacterium]
MSVQTNQRPPTSLNTNQVLSVNESVVSSNEKYALILQSDGNLVLYSQGKAIWASWTVGKGGVKLIMQTDGNLVMYDKDWKAIWNSKTSGKGTSFLCMQDDGNLVIYNTKSYTWASWTVGR